MKNPETLRTISINARRDVIARFSEENMASGIMDFIRGISTLA
jgi:hypothetical protein